MSSLTVTRSDVPREARGASREPALSVIATGTTIHGELSSDGIVKIEGVVIGKVRAARQVLVAKGGRIEGDVLTREAVVGGEIHGAVLADDRVEVQSSSVIQGDITTQRIVVHEGGEVNGHVRMENPDALTRTDAGAVHPEAEPTDERSGGSGFPTPDAS